ncbi:MAG: M6 family metalloprotease domain-containing protein [Prevotella sp.]|nr:M6 family metalloprotease domain-containing protein [Prevotella sp.]
MRKIILTLMLLSCICMAKAIPADPTPIRVTQPDGSIVTIQLHGDEWLHFTTTTDGYTVVTDERGYYVYAQLQDGKLLPTNVIAHDADGRDVNETDYLSHVKKYLTPQMDETTAETKKKVRAMQRQALQKRKAAQYDYNKFRGLIILVEFNDRQFSRSDYKDLINDMVNKENYTGFTDTDGKFQTYTGSVRDYFHDNSNGVFNPEFDVVGPVTVDYSQEDGNKYSYSIMKAAVQAADSLVDYSLYDRDNDGTMDMVYFIFAGTASSSDPDHPNRLWPHRSIINNVKCDGVWIKDYACSTEFIYSEKYNMLDGIGTFCHEFSHVLGLPDFYDTDGDDSGGRSHDPGDWSVMAGGCYHNNGRTPCAYSLYERMATGFTEPMVINTKGHYTLEQIGTSNTGYRIDSPVEGEYFLLENRQKDYKWDKYLANSGMLVFRVDRSDMTPWNNNSVNDNPERMFYELLRAGGVEKAYTNPDYDPFPGKGEVTTLSNETSPAHLRTHDGQDTPWVIHHIAEANGEISFDVSAFTYATNTDLKVTSIDILGGPYAGSQQLVNVTVESYKDDYHPLYLFASKTDDMGTAVYATGADIKVNSSEVVTFYFKPEETGTWNLWVCTDSEGKNIVGQTTEEITDIPTEEALLKSSNVKLSPGTTTTLTLTINNKGNVAYHREITAYLNIFDETSSTRIQTVNTRPLKIAPGDSIVQTITFEGLEEGMEYRITGYYYRTHNENKRTPLVSQEFTVPTSSGIKEVITETDKAPWYTVDGWRLADKPRKPGLYIHRGKKVVIR